jgi:phosphate uptake regulator
MTNEASPATTVVGSLSELERRLIDMGNLVESLFVGSVVALIDRTDEGMPELREEDCRAHERCLEIERAAAGVLAADGLEVAQVRFVLATVKIAGALKRAADEALRIAEGLRSCGAEDLGAARVPGAMSEMTALVQTMLGEAVASIAERRESEMEPLHASMRELAKLNVQALDQLVAGAARHGEHAVGVFLRAAQHLERIGHEALDVATQVRHLYVPNHE